jgi:hypothetical protein
MRSKHFVVGLVVGLVLLATPMPGSAGAIAPSTTVAAQTSNNTSASGAFSNQSNGNLGAANVSKLDVHSLLSSGNATKVYAHLLLWFGGSNHMNVGYSSTDPAQVKRQIADMISRGIDGVIIDWYGPNNSIDAATQLVMKEAENHPGFSFAIMIDQGAIRWNSCSGCSPQQALTDQLQYIERTYFPSPAYLTRQGQPVVTNFNIDLAYSVDWNAANAALRTRPLFMFQNNSGFTHPLSNGSYSWVMPTTTDYGAGYLSSFYDMGTSFPTEQTMGAAYKGFNDTLASWGANRIMGQQCGQTWLQTFSDFNAGSGSGKEPPALQLVTWNDYEEGTEIESGIDNCLALSASVAGKTLQWTMQGNEDTVDHYAVYVSTDGQNLGSLTDVAAGTRSLDLCGFALAEGNYSLFVQAVGKPSIANAMTGAVAYSAACKTAAAPPALAFDASPATIVLSAGQSKTFRVTARMQSGSFNNPIFLSVTGCPSQWSCSFSPDSVIPGSGAASSVLTIRVAPINGTNLPQQRKLIPIDVAWLMPFGIAGFAFAGTAKRRRGTQALCLLAIFAVGMAASSCGGISTGVQNVASASGNYTLTVDGISNTSHFSTTVAVTVQ